MLDNNMLDHVIHQEAYKQICCTYTQTAHEEAVKWTEPSQQASVCPSHGADASVGARTFAADTNTQTDRTNNDLLP